MSQPSAKLYQRRLNRELGEIILFICAFFALLAVGTMGYMVIERWAFLDALFMTVTSVSTVGYGEVHPLSSGGRIFSMVLIISGVGLFGITLARVSQGIIHRQLNWLFHKRNMYDQIDKLSGHTIVCGFGRLSRISAGELQSAGEQIVIIDRDPERVKTAEEAGFITVTGDAGEDDTLLAAGIKRAARFLTLLPKASDNLYAILNARELNGQIYIVSRAELDSDDKLLRRAGANRVISPYRIGGKKIAESLIRPYVSEFIDLASSSAGLILEEIPIPQNSPISGKSIKDFDIRKKTNIIIAAIVSKDGIAQFNPAAETVVEPGSTLIGLGMKQDIELLEQLIDPANIPG